VTERISLALQALKLNDSVAAALLTQCAGAALPVLIDDLVALSQGYDKALLEICLAAIERCDLSGAAALDARLGAESAWRQRTLGLWLSARLLELRGQSEAALAAWGLVIDRGAGAIHEAYLSRARLRGQRGLLAEAFADLRQALAGQEDQIFLSKAARVFERLARRGHLPAARKARIALLASTTTDLLAPLLRLACFRDGIGAELYVAPYGNLRQEILNPASGLYRFAPDVVVIGTGWRDANLPAYSESPAGEVRRVVDELQQLWATLLQRHACRIIQHSFDQPAVDSYGQLSRALRGGRGHMLREINRHLLEVAPPAVALLDLEHVSGLYGRRAWSDATAWYTAKQYPAAEALPSLVDHQVALIRAGLGLTRKVLVLDLDNTLWGGVIGEEGLEGIRLGPPSAAGEAYQEVQRYAAELKARGILLAVCSKNNEADAAAPFLRHDAMILRLEDFVAFRANWLDKPTNLRAIAEQLNLGVDSLVFLDDNPVERAIVRRELPEVAVPELGPDPAGFVAALDRGRYFEALALSQEDLERHQSYCANALRDELRTAAGSLEDFLHSLTMIAEIGPFDEAVLSRVVQLIGKTNQFNLTTRRHSEAQLRRMMGSGTHWTCYFKLRDRFGDNGLVGLLIAGQAADDATAWEIDTWLMSCRVIGRQLEQLMLWRLAEAARARGVRRLFGTYIPTAKNAMVSELYPQLGFERVERLSDGAEQYVLDLTLQDIPPCAFISIEASVAC
jgi:FkbH-like protein